MKDEYLVRSCYRGEELQHLLSRYDIGLEVLEKSKFGQEFEIHALPQGGRRFVDIDVPQQTAGWNSRELIVESWWNGRVYEKQAQPAFAGRQKRTHCIRFDRRLLVDWLVWVGLDKSLGHIRIEVAEIKAIIVVREKSYNRQIFALDYRRTRQVLQSIDRNVMSVHSNQHLIKAIIVELQLVRSELNSVEIENQAISNLIWLGENLLQPGIKVPQTC